MEILSHRGLWKINSEGNTFNSVKESIDNSAEREKKDQILDLKGFGEKSYEKLATKIKEHQVDA